MGRMILIFLLLLGSVCLGVLLKQDPGYVLIAIHHWTIETTLWVAIISLVLVFFLLHIFLLMLQWFMRLPTTFSHWLTKRRVHQAQATTRQGLIEFSEGHWLKAKNHLIKALPDTDAPLLNYLTAARAAQEMGDNQMRDNYLRQAQQSMPEAKIAVELTQAQLQLANHQWEQALATLRHLQDLAPHHPYVLKLLMHLYQEVRDWPQLIKLLPDLKRQQVVSEDAYLLLEQQTYIEAIRDLIKQDQLKALTELVKQLPKNLMYDETLMKEYTQYLVKKREDVQVESILRRCLRKKFNESWIEIYGMAKTNESQLNFAESFLKDHPHSAALFLCLGRLSKEKNLWGKAKIYFEQSIKFGASPQAYLELGQLLEQLSDANGACRAYQKGLLIHQEEQEASQYP